MQYLVFFMSQTLDVDTYKKTKIVSSDMNRIIISLYACIYRGKATTYKDIEIVIH